MDADGMPPPLEDMTATLEQARKLRDLRLGKQEKPTTTHTSTESKSKKKKATEQTPTPTPTVAPSHSHTEASKTPTQEKSKTVKPTPDAKSGSGDFGGLKKGFLFGGPKPSHASGAQQTKTECQKTKTDSGKTDSRPQADSIPFVKPKTRDKDSGLKLDEVQKAMESTKGFLQDKDWVTEDLLEKVQKNDTLSKQLGDPRFMQAVTEFQTNPQAAMLKYQGNPEMQQFLKEFCGILGEHFSSLGEKEDSQSGPQGQNPSTTVHTGPKIRELTDEDMSPSARPQESTVPVDPHVQQILVDPANREILMDPRIQQLIENLRSNPEKAQRMLREGDTAFRQKVDKLITLGLLKFQA